LSGSGRSMRSIDFASTYTAISFHANAANACTQCIVTSVSHWLLRIAMSLCRVFACRLRPLRQVVVAKHDAAAHCQLFMYGCRAVLVPALFCTCVDTPADCLTRSGNREWGEAGLASLLELIQVSQHGLDVLFAECTLHYAESCAMMLMGHCMCRVSHTHTLHAHVCGVGWMVDVLLPRSMWMARWRLAHVAGRTTTHTIPTPPRVWSTPPVFCFRRRPSALHASHAPAAMGC